MSGMPCVERVAEASADDVWAVLSDGWLYPLWVVGAARIRDVEATWPKVGARLHHSFGLWPMLMHDETEVLEVVPGEFLQLRARGWPMGEAQVELRLEQSEPERTTIRLCEKVVRGPGKLIPAPVEAPLMIWRNNETLRRLVMLAEGRADRPTGGHPAASS